MPGIVLDELEAERIGAWRSSRSFGGFVGQAYHHDTNHHKGAAEVRYATTVGQSGTYEIRLYFTASSNRATQVPVTITSARGAMEVMVNQKKPLAGKPYLALTTLPLESGERFELVISNRGTDGYVVADAVQLVRLPGGP